MPLLTHKHTHSYTFIHTRGPSDVSRGDFPCHMRASDRHYKCCVTVWLHHHATAQLPLVFFSILSLFLCLCLSLVSPVSPRSAVSSPACPELMPTLSCLLGGFQFSRPFHSRMSLLFFISNQTALLHCLLCFCFFFCSTSHFTKADHGQKREKHAGSGTRLQIWTKLFPFGFCRNVKHSGMNVR